MRKLFLIGALSLGLMSFIVVDSDYDCWGLADQTVAALCDFLPNEQAENALWEHTYLKCAEENGMLLDAVIVDAN